MRTLYEIPKKLSRVVRDRVGVGLNKYSKVGRTKASQLEERGKRQKPSAYPIPQRRRLLGEPGRNTSHRPEIFRQSEFFHPYLHYVLSATHEHATTNILPCISPP
jgi:hypothetical protein